MTYQMNKPLSQCLLYIMLMRLASIGVFFAPIFGGYMRRENSSGTVYKLSGKRRRPWVAATTIGFEMNHEKGTTLQKRQILGYFRTRIDAENALNNYIMNPYDIQILSITFAQLYERWSEEYFETLSNTSGIRSYTAAYKYCKSLYNMRFRDIRVSHMQGAIRDCTAGDATKGRMKSMFNMMFRYAMVHEIVDKNYASLFSHKNTTPKKDKVPFSNAEIAKLWKNIDYPYVDMLLFYLYQGYRPSEGILIKTDNVDLERRTIVEGIKTDAGRDRLIPIHDSVYPIVQKWYREDSEYLFRNDNGFPLTYDQYRGRFKKVMTRLSLNHTPHETRHTFITCAKHLKLPDGVIDAIVGHESDDLDDRVYNHIPMRDLREYLNKINYEWDDSDMF